MLLPLATILPLLSNLMVVNYTKRYNCSIFNFTRNQAFRAEGEESQSAGADDVSVTVFLGQLATLRLLLLHDGLGRQRMTFVAKENAVAKDERINEKLLGSTSGIVGQCTNSKHLFSNQKYTHSTQEHYLLTYTCVLVSVLDSLVRMHLYQNSRYFWQAL